MGWWKAESNALDVTGTNNGVLDGTIGFASGEVGQTFWFNTTNADVRVPASASLNVGNNTGPGVETGARGPAQTIYMNDPNNHLIEIRTYD